MQSGQMRRVLADVNQVKVCQERKSERIISHTLYKGSKRNRDAKKAERSRWKSTWGLNPDGTAKGYLSYTCKTYLVCSFRLISHGDVDEADF